MVAPGTGIVLQNRGACFELQGGVVRGARPYHTIIPGMLTRAGRLVGPFGVMGGLIQAQAHMQLVSALVDDGLDPQAALDRPRSGSTATRSPRGRPRESRSELERLGYQVVRDDDVSGSAAARPILVDGDGALGGSDRVRTGTRPGSERGRIGARLVRDGGRGSRCSPSSGIGSHGAA